MTLEIHSRKDATMSIAFHNKILQQFNCALFTTETTTDKQKAKQMVFSK